MLVTPLLAAGLGTVLVATAFLFGMAGRLVPAGVLLAILPLPAAMALRAITHIASKLWRGLLWWRHVRWKAALPHVAGSLAEVAAWSLVRYGPGSDCGALARGDAVPRPGSAGRAED